MLNRLAEKFLALLTKFGILGPKDHPNTIFVRLAKRYALVAQDASEEFMRNLKKNPRTVTGNIIAACSTAMLKIQQNTIAQLDDIVAWRAVDTYHRADAARVVFASCLIEAL